MFSFVVSLISAWQIFSFNFFLDSFPKSDACKQVIVRFYFTLVFGLYLLYVTHDLHRLIFITLLFLFSCALDTILWVFLEGISIEIISCCLYLLCLVSIYFIMILLAVRFIRSKTVVVRDWVQLPEIENHPGPDWLFPWNRKSEHRVQLLPRVLSLCSVILSIRLSSHGGLSVPEDGCNFGLPSTFQTG